MASNRQGRDLRGELVDLLLEKVASDRYPSSTVMDMLEDLLTDEDLPAYAGVLMDKVRTDKYPSNSIIRRLLAVTS